MKFSWTLVIVAIIAYFVGVKFGGVGNSLLSKVGL